MSDAMLWVSIFVVDAIYYFYYVTVAVAGVGDRLATIDMGRKVRGCCALF